MGSRWMEQCMKKHQDQRECQGRKRKKKCRMAEVSHGKKEDVCYEIKLIKDVERRILCKALDTILRILGFYAKS